MKKVFAAGVLAVFLLLPLMALAVPLDLPYQILVDSSNTTSNFITLSTTTFPSSSAAVNSGAAGAQWCLSHVHVAAPGLTTITMFWATQMPQNGTTDYVAVSSSTYDVQWPYHTPYCAPSGNNALTIKSGVAGSTITVEGFMYKGWTP